MNTFRKTLGMLAAAAAVTFAPFASAVTPAAAQALNPAASASCSTPDVPASTTYAALAETPAIATQYQLTGTTLVKVELEPNGSIRDASVAKSSGAPILDMAAVAAAKASTFSPEIRDCAPVAGSYLFQVDFTP
jgi:TonB family protein